MSYVHRFRFTCCDCGQHACGQIDQPMYNDVKIIRRSGLNEETINDGLAVAFKSSGTANWDPQPAVDKFLTVKDRRQTAPDIETYKNVNLCGNFPSK